MAFELLSKNYKSVEATLAADKSAGDYFVQGNLRGFVIVDVDYSEQPQATVIFEAELVKCVKAAGEAWVAGTALYWSGTAVTTTASTYDLIGFVAKAAASADVIGYMVFDGRAEILVT